MIHTVDVLPLSNLIATIVGSAATIIVAALTTIAVVFQARKPPKARDDMRADDGAIPALAAWQGSQNELIEILIRQVNSLTGKHEQLQEFVTEEADRTEKFTGAVRRYLETLAYGWPGPGKMPWPIEADWDLLEKTLPAALIHSKRQQRQQ